MAGRFPTAWLDELYARADIVSVVSGYLSLKKDGRRYWGLCPFHNEKTPSFSVNADLNLYYCFGCKAGGNVVQFIMEMERVSFQEAVKILAEKTHMTVPEMQEDPDYERRRSERDRLLSANREAARFFHDNIWKPEGKFVLDYLHGRGLDDGIIRRFGLGAATEQWDDLLKHLTDKGFTRREIVLAGLAVEKGDHAYDMFRTRAIFPIIDQQGNVLGFGGRAMGDAKPKYLNTSDTPIFNKRKGVYAINLVKKQRDLKRILLVEGYMDVVAVTQAGIQGAVATLGTSLTNEQARLLKRYVPEVWIAYDGDEAGQMAIERAIGIFEQEEVPVKVLSFPDKLDPDEMIRQRGVDAFLAVKPIGSVTYKMSRLRLQFDLETLDGRTEYAKKCAQILKNVKEPVEMDNHLEALSVQTGFSKEVLMAQIGISPESIGQNKQPQKRKEYSGNPRRLPQTYKTEQTLLALLGLGTLPQGTVKEEDFNIPQFRTIAAALIRGDTPAKIMAEAEKEDILQAAGEVFTILSDEEKANPAKVAEDCLHKLHMQRLEQQINDMKQLMASAQDGEARAEALKAISSYSNELARLRKQGR